MVVVNTFATWLEVTFSARVPTDTSWHRMISPATPTVRKAEATWLTRQKYPKPLNLTWTLADTFRCGGIVQESTRNVFRYHRKNATAATTVNTTSSINSTKTFQDTSNSSKNVVSEKSIISEMAEMTRIVNGEDCPPGQCPWQVSVW